MWYSSRRPQGSAVTGKASETCLRRGAGRPSGSEMAQAAI